MDLDLIGVTASSISAIQPMRPRSGGRPPRGIRGVAREERTGDPSALMKSTPESSTQEVLAGLVERVTFHNAENGFCVLRAKARGHRDLVTVVGHAAIISAGEWITASGEWINEPYAPDSTSRAHQGHSAVASGAGGRNPRRSLLVERRRLFLRVSKRVDNVSRGRLAPRAARRPRSSRRSGSASVAVRGRGIRRRTDRPGGAMRLITR